MLRTLLDQLLIDAIGFLEIIEIPLGVGKIEFEFGNARCELHRLGKLLGRQFPVPRSEENHADVIERLGEVGPGRNHLAVGCEHLLTISLGLVGNQGEVVEDFRIVLYQFLGTLEDVSSCLLLAHQIVGPGEVLHHGHVDLVLLEESPCRFDDPQVLPPLDQNIDLEVLEVHILHVFRGSSLCKTLGFRQSTCSGQQGYGQTPCVHGFRVGFESLDGAVDSLIALPESDLHHRQLVVSFRVVRRQTEQRTQFLFGQSPVSSLTGSPILLHEDITAGTKHRCGGG